MLRRLRHKCNSSGMSKMFYLACATLFVSALMIECILVVLVVTPYITETAFQNTVCSYVSKTPAGNQTCQNRCSKNSSKFPCIKVNVTFVDANAKQQWGYAFDYYSTYSVFNALKCVASPCELREEENQSFLASYTAELERSINFTCYYLLKNDGQGADVLLWKLHPRSLMFHSVLWGSLIMGTGILGILFTWCTAGCSAWSDDKLVIS